MIEGCVRVLAKVAPSVYRTRRARLCASRETLSQGPRPYPAAVDHVHVCYPSHVGRHCRNCHRTAPTRIQTLAGDPCHPRDGRLYSSDLCSCSYSSFYFCCETSRSYQISCRIYVAPSPRRDHGQGHGDAPHARTCSHDARADGQASAHRPGYCVSNPYQTHCHCSSAARGHRFHRQ